MKIVRGLPPEVPPKTWVGVDVEIFRHEGPLHRPRGDFACLSVSLPDETVYQITDHHDVPKVLERIKKASWILQNAMYDIRQLRRWADIPQRKVWDTMLMEQDMFGGLYALFGLDDLVRRWLGVKLDKGPRKRFETATEMDAEMAEYAAWDPVWTVRVAKAQRAWQKAEDEVMRCYWEIDEPAMWAVMDMGPMRVDVDAWLKATDEFEVVGRRIEQELGFNVKSPEQIRKAVRKNIGRPIPNARSEETLEPLRDGLAEDTKERAFMDLLLKARSYRDASSKYGRGWIEKNVEEGGLVWGGWRVTGAETGRMACREPNLQNIPVRDMPIFRSFFVASPGNQLVIGDVSQQEPRISAYMTQDERLIEAVRNSEVYENVAKMMGLTDRPKTGIKPVTLGSIYGLTEYGMEKKYGIPLATGKANLARFFSTFKGVRMWINSTRIKGEQMGYVRTASGRRCWLNHHIHTSKNNAINAPIQGSAADMTKLSLVTAHKESALQGLPFCVRMVIHDEKDSDTPKDPRFVEFEKETWVEAGRRLIPGIPIVTEVVTGQNWGAK